jgi:glucose/arabinose dehydrogenase
MLSMRNASQDASASKKRSPAWAACLALALLAGFSGCSSKVTGTNGNTGVHYPSFTNLMFVRPLDLQYANDGSGRLFVVEQRGMIHVIKKTGETDTSLVFLDIRSRVAYNGAEQGLLGLAFHPHYTENGYFYVDYTAAGTGRTTVSRFAVSAANPDSADAASEQVLLDIAQPFSNHNGGCTRFGPDGYLYIGMGDGGGAGDPNGNAQNRTTLLGALLRIDVDNPAGGKNYGIPADNPFAGNDQGFREEIYAYGLRNPWRFSFDPPTGRLWLADVGQSSLEEIDIIENGMNYGWNIMEGDACYNPPSGCDMTGLALPVYEYSHALGSAITGGFVYRGPSLPSLAGTYIYGDYGSGRIWSLAYDGVNPPVNTELLDTGLNIVSFGIDGNGELYICAFDGKIYLLKDLLGG